MAQLSKSAFNALYGQPSGTTFPDNTTQEISANDVRQQGEDIKDSFLNRADDFIDEDSFATDSATKVPSQQSTKAYIASVISSLIGGSTGSTDNSVLRSDGTGGATIQPSAILIDDFGNMDIPGSSGVISGLGQIRLEIGVTNGTNDSVSVLRLFHSGGNGNNVGVAMEFACRTATSNDEIGAIIQAIATSVTSTSEAFDLVFSVMSGGSAAGEAMRLRSNKSMTVQGPLVFKSYTVATVPTASSYTGGQIYVSDESGGAVMAFSDGTDWRRVTDRAIIS
jgi:hypothetical protein